MCESECMCPHVERDTHPHHSYYIPSGISGGSSTCIPCIVVPLAVILAALAVAAVIAAFVYYRWKKAPSTKLKEKDAEGING